MQPSSPFSQEIYLLLKEIYLILDNGDRLLLQKSGMSVGRFNLLSHLATHTELSPKELSTIMLCNKSNITRLLLGVEKEGWITRRRDDADGRRQYIRLTPAGKSRWEKAYTELLDYTAERFKIFNAHEQQELKGILSRLKDSLHEQLIQL